MAPKGAKRGNTANAAGRPRKVAKPTPQEEQLQTVSKALESMPSLPDSCRAMLLAVLPSSLGVPRDARHAVQEHVIAMIGDALTKVQSEKEVALAQAGERAATAQDRQAELKAAHTCAASALEGKTKAMLEKKGALDAAASLLDEARAALATRRQEQQTASDAEAAKREECAAFDAAVSEHFAPLKEGAWDEGASTAQGLLDALDATLRKAELDSSVMASLRISGSKKGSERTNFDSMVLEQVGSTMAEKADSLKKELADKGPRVAECSAAVAAQSSEVEKAEEKVKECKSAFEQAQSEQQESDAECKAAARDLEARAAEATKAAWARDAARAELELFASGPLGAFEALRGATASTAEAVVDAAASADDGAVTVTAGGA